MAHIEQRIQQLENDFEVIHDALLDIQEKLSGGDKANALKETLNSLTQQAETMQHQIKNIDWYTTTKALQDQIEDLQHSKHPDSIQAQIENITDSLYKQDEMLQQFEIKLSELTTGSHVQIYTDDQLKDLLVSAESSQAELSDKLNYSKSNISRILNGQIKDPFIRANIAEFLIRKIHENQKKRA